MFKCRVNDKYESQESCQPDDYSENDGANGFGDVGIDDEFTLKVVIIAELLQNSVLHRQDFGTPHIVFIHPRELLN